MKVPLLVLVVIVQEVSSLVKSFKIFFSVLCAFALILFEIILAASANTL